MQYTHIKKIITVPALVHIARVKSSPPLSGAASLPNIINTPCSTHPISSAHIPCPRPRPMNTPPLPTHHRTVYNDNVKVNIPRELLPVAAAILYLSPSEGMGGRRSKGA